MGLKKIIAVDSTSRRVEAEVDEGRLTAFDGIARQIIGPFGCGGGSEFSKYTAADDQAAFAFLVSQLAYTEQEVFSKLYQPLQYANLIPIKTSQLPPGVQSVRYRIKDVAGMGRRTAINGQDIPTVKTSYADKTFPVVYGTVGYEYSREEARIAAYLGLPLETEYMLDAIQGFDRHMNDVGLVGETISGITGLFNNASVPSGNRPSGFAWDNGSQTATGILNDINAGINAVWQATSFTSVVDTILVPSGVWTALQAPRSSTGTDTTILQFIQKNSVAGTVNGGVAPTILPAFGLDTAGAGGTRRAVFYCRNPQNLVMHIPMPVSFLPPQYDGTLVKVPGEYKYSGVEIRRPKTAYYMDGV